eukprot:8570593-Alexandrium_andersonii.AAC.1
MARARTSRAKQKRSLRGGEPGGLEREPQRRPQRAYGLDFTSRCQRGLRGALQGLTGHQSLRLSRSCFIDHGGLMHRSQ